MSLTSNWKAITWSPNDVITDEKLQGMVANDELLKNNVLQTTYRGNSGSQSQGLRLLAGTATISSTKKSASAARSISFGSFFSSNVKPIISTGLVSKNQRQVFLTVSGQGNIVIPNNKGMVVHVFVAPSSKKKNITNTLYVHWHALGY